MNQQEFPGILDQIEPEKILGNDSKDALASFFIVLSVVYNNLKSLVSFQDIVAKNYRTPSPTEVTAHAGEYSGIGIHTTKLLLGTIHEFLQFIKSSEKIFNTPEFKEVMNGTNAHIKGLWGNIFDIALEKDASKGDFSHNLMLIRNHIAFHYAQSGKELAEAYKRFFFQKDKQDRNTLAYYFIGSTMKNTRFCYADAVVEEYLRDKNPITSKDTKIFSMNGYSPEMIQFLININHAISRLLKSYLKKCSYKR